MKIDKYNLSGGMNQKTSPLFIADNECELVQNYHMDNLGSLTKRAGIANLIGQTVNDKAITGLYFFADNIGTDYTNLLVRVSTFIKKITTNAWANSLATGLTDGAQGYFATFIDYVFHTDGGNSAMASSADLSTWGTTNCLATLKPKYVCQWEDRVYALNDASSTAYPSRIYWSPLPSGTPLAITWAPTTDYADINPDDNDEITWGEPFGTKMLIFKTKAIYNWTFGQVEPDKLIEVGTPEGRTVKQTQGICFFANEYGVYAYTGYGKPLKISKKVQGFIDAVTSWTSTRAEVDDDHYCLYIGDVTVGGVAYSKVMLVYTLSIKGWHFETYPFAITAMARFRRLTTGTTEIYDTIYLGDDDGYVYRKGTGTADYNGTTIANINGRIITKEYPLFDFPKTSQLQNLWFLAQKGTGARVNYRIDRGDWKPWKDLKQRITEGALSGRAKTIQFSITDNSQTQSQIEGFSVEVKGEQETRRVISK
jgi:hypothetical protein